MGLKKDEATRKTRVKYNSNSYAYRYYFECSDCGSEIVAQPSNLKIHSGKCRSCTQKRRPHQAAYNSMVASAKKRHLGDVMSYTDFINLCGYEKCYYCSARIERPDKRGEWGYRGYFIDRIDNSRGYSFDNCIQCCFACNVAKGDRYAHDEFVQISQLITSMRGGQVWPTEYIEKLKRKPDVSA